MAWAPDYCTASDLKAFVRIDDAEDDAQVALAIAAASRAVDKATNRQFGNTGTAEERFFTASFDRRRCRWTVAIDDVMALTDFAVSYDSADDGTYSDGITNYQLRDVNAAAKGMPWTEIVIRPGSSILPSAREDAVKVEAIFGWSAVPSAVKEATLLQASRLLSRRDSPFGVAGSPDQGSEVRLLSRLDPDVAVLIASYMRWWGAV